MDFTEVYKQTGSLVYFSAGGHFLLSAIQDRLIVRRTDTLQIARTCLVDTPPSSTFTAIALSTSSKRGDLDNVSDGWITHAGWSADSELLLAACARRGTVTVFRMRDELWRATIAAGAEGLVRAEFAPDGRSVLCFSEWGCSPFADTFILGVRRPSQLRVTIWSLVTGAATYIQYPIHPDRGYAFRKDGRYFVLAERHKSKDTLGVYDSDDQFKLVRHYPSPTSSLAALSLSPNGKHIAVWEGPLDFKLHVLSLTGTLLGTFIPDVDPGYGVRTIAWHPGSTLLAVGGYDDKIYILENLTWRCVAVFMLNPRIPAGVTIWREHSGWLEATHGRGFLSYERLQAPHTIEVTRIETSKAQPRTGVVELEWNRIGTCLSARFESAPHVLHLFAFPSPKGKEPAPFAPRLASVLIQQKPITHSRWNPERAGRLALSCGGPAMYTWSDEWVVADTEEVEGEEMAECIGVPADGFDVKDLKWAPDGKGLMLLDKDTFCCAFEVEEEGQNSG